MCGCRVQGSVFDTYQLLCDSLEAQSQLLATSTQGGGEGYTAGAHAEGGAGLRARAWAAVSEAARVCSVVAANSDLHMYLAVKVGLLFEGQGGEGQGGGSLWLPEVRRHMCLLGRGACSMRCCV